MYALLKFFLVWRILLFLPLLAGFLFLSYRPDHAYTNLWKFTKPYVPVDHFLLYPWANFDGIHYLSIAGQGYNHDEGFFPLFPLAIRAVSSVLGDGQPFSASYFFAGLLFANAAFLAAIFLLRQLLLLDYKESVVHKSILYLLIFPTVFFFASIYSESLFLLLTIASFYFARKKQWLFASICAMLLSATRIVGISIVPALLLEFFLQEKKIVAKKAIPLLLAPLGLLSFMLYNTIQLKSSLAFLTFHTTIGTSRSDTIILLPQTLFRYGKILFTVSSRQYEWWIAFLELFSFFFAALLLFVAWKKGVRISYLVFAILSFLIPASSGTFNGLPRYIVILFPMFVALALIKSKLLQYVYLAIAPILLFLLLLLFSRGYFIA